MWPESAPDTWERDRFAWHRFRVKTFVKLPPLPKQLVEETRGFTQALDETYEGCETVLGGSSLSDFGKKYSPSIPSSNG